MIYMLRRNCLLKHITLGTIEGPERRRKQLLVNLEVKKRLESEGESTRSQSGEFWSWLNPCRMTV